MDRIKKNRYYIAFILALCLVFVGIVTFHSYYNLKNIIQAPSEEWGRATSLKAQDLYKKQSSALIYDEYVEVLAANKSDFTIMKIDRITRETSYSTFKIKGVEPYKVQQFEWDSNNIYFIENNNLYFVTKNAKGGYSAKVKIADNINDFDILVLEQKTIIVAASKSGLVAYKQGEGNFTQAGDAYNLNGLKNVSSVIDNKGIIHIAAFAEKSSIEFPIYYLTLDQNKWTVRGSKVEKSLSESWGINNIEIGLDDTDAYIFYEMIKWDKFGIAAKTHYTVLPLYADETELTFDRFFLTKEDELNSSVFINEPRLIKTQSNELKLTIVRDSYDKKYQNGFSAYVVTMDKGEIKDLTRATLNRRLVTHTVYENYKGNDILIYLDAAGGFNYEAFYTETGTDYITNAAKPTKDDYLVAVMETVPGYVSTLLVMIIKFTIYSPAILWFLIIEFFEIRRLKERPRLSYTIGFIIYVIIKLITFGTYYTPLSISQMPPILRFDGAYYFYAIGIAFLALFIQKILKKHNPEMNLILEYIIFAVIDIQITNMIYATYMV